MEIVIMMSNRITNQLTEKQKMIVLNVRSFVEQKLANDFSGHDMAHIERVVKLTQRILQNEPKANYFIVILSAYLHDVIDEKVIANVTQAVDEVCVFLKQQNVNDDEIQIILDIIENISYRKNLTQKKVLPLEGQIVQDADRLDAMGAIGIGRTFYYGGNKHNIMHDPKILPRTTLTENNYKQPSTVINHFYEKLFLLKDMMNTKSGKKLAEKKHDFLVQFIRVFEQEWQGKDEL